jgi:hypothetical protein
MAYMNGDIYLDGTLLTAFGRTYSESVIEISRGDRTASGKKVSDIIATKKRFELSYSYIDGDELKVFEDFYNENSEHTLEIYRKDNETTTTTTTDDPDYHETYTVLMEPIDKTRVLLLGEGLWGGVKIVFEEV